MASDRRVALVTGGARGIGLGISTQLAKAGFALAVCGQRPSDAAQDVIEGLRTFGTDVEYFQADISDADARRELLAAVEKRFGRLDVLVNNAGIAPKVRADILNATEASFDELISVNLKGPYFLTQAVANSMIRQREANGLFAGCIINVSSVSATVASVNRGDYCISKAGIAMATKLWAARLGEYGISVYEIQPGVIRTDMTSGVTEKYDKLIADGLLVEPRWGTPDDIGRAAAALATGSLPYATGQVLVIDGGLTLKRL
ncbi:MAG: 3-ketoacyl-ACP reductase [Planctomycetota bacterium]